MYTSAVSGSQGSVWQLVDQYMQLERIPREQLVKKRDGLNSRNSMFSELDSILSALKSKMSYFTDEISNPFYVKQGTSSDPNLVGVTAQSSAVSGNHSISVGRLAKADTRVSNQFNDADSSFTSFTSDQTFTIEVGHPTDIDANNRVQISVTVAASVFSGTDDEVLSAISDAVNEAMSQAVTDETIASDEVIHSSVVSEESGKSRLVFSSEQTGYTYRMDFGTSTLLDALNINNTVQSSGTTGGYITAVGTGPTDSELNSMFTMDGLTFYRDSNNVDDAISGVTLKLYDIFTQNETVTISADTDAIKTDVEDFISKYNDAITFLRQKTRVDPDTHERGPLSTDFTYRGIISDFRSIVGSEVTSTASAEYNLLYDIGIEAAQDGTLSITDVSKFQSALEVNPQYVSDLFRTSDGVAQKLEDYIDSYVKTGGIIDSTKENITNSITHLNDRIGYMDELLAKKEKQYFDEFTKMQQTILMLQNQQAFFNSFMNGNYSSF